MKMIESARLAAAGTTTVGTHEHPDRRRGSYLNRTRGLKHAAKLAPDAGYCEQNIYKDKTGGSRPSEALQKTI